MLSLGWVNYMRCVVVAGVVGVGDNDNDYVGVL